MTVKYTFTCERDSSVNTLVNYGEKTLSEIIEQFELFLRGSGYDVNGYLDIVEVHDKISKQDDYEFKFDDEIKLDFDSDILNPWSANLAYSYADDLIKSENC